MDSAPTESHRQRFSCRYNTPIRPGRRANRRYRPRFAGDSRMQENEPSQQSMPNVRVVRTVLITGASGNLGTKLRNQLQGRYELCLLDRNPRGDAAIRSADLSIWDVEW